MVYSPAGGKELRVFSRIIRSYYSGYCPLIEDDIWVVLVKICQNKWEMLKNEQAILVDSLSTYDRKLHPTGCRDFQDLLITTVWYSWLMPGKLKSPCRTVYILSSLAFSIPDFQPWDLFHQVLLISQWDMTGASSSSCLFLPLHVLVYEMLSISELHTKLIAVWQKLYEWAQYWVVWTYFCI